LKRKAILALFLCVCALYAYAEENSRHFKFRYGFRVKGVPAGQQLRVWIPLAHSDAYQQVRLLSANGDLPLKKTRGENGNLMLYGATKKAGAAEYQFTVEYDVVRKERLAFGPAVKAVNLSKSELSQYLQPDKLVPTTGLPAELAVQVVNGRSSQLEKARAIYDYVFENMKYDKSGTGWGRGDTLYACNAKKGNCTDFHALFISMARSQGIPSRFEIGFPIPADKDSGSLGGYHCWSDFYVPGRGWVPVDISEAWKDPAKKDYFFGSNDVNRVQFSQGRDLLLSPHQDGEPLNYFVYPYVEAGGKVHINVSTDFSFADEPLPVVRGN
jgi:Transglutaminase-like superfamily